jgi:hypothetical protein
VLPQAVGKCGLVEPSRSRRRRRRSRRPRARHRLRSEKIHDITELVRGHLQDFLGIYGVTLNDVKVLMRPRDERMRELISLRAFGLSEIEAVRY